MNRSALLKVVAHFARHPSQGLVVARAGWRLRRRHWWRQFPFLPLPSRDYWHFRVTTAFGERGPVSLVPSEMVAAARWSLRQRNGK